MSTNSLPQLDLSPELIEAAQVSKAWPFEEARKLVKRLEKKPKTGPVLFQTGYGPSVCLTWAPLAKLHVHHGPHRLPAAHAGQDPDQADLLL